VIFQENNLKSSFVFNSKSQELQGKFDQFCLEVFPTQRGKKEKKKAISKKNNSPQQEQQPAALIAQLESEIQKLKAQYAEQQQQLENVQNQLESVIGILVSYNMITGK
jgi:molecular chaperone GrpE (heat shock protein)